MPMSQDTGAASVHGGECAGRCGVYTTVLLSHENEETLSSTTTCMDRKCQVKQGGQRQRLCDLTYMWELTKKKPRKEMVFVVTRGAGSGGRWSKGTNFQL